MATSCQGSVRKEVILIAVVIIYDLQDQKHHKLPSVIYS